MASTEREAMSSNRQSPERLGAQPTNDGGARFGKAHRLTVGNLLASMRELGRLARSANLDTTEVEQALDGLERRVDPILPKAQQDQVQAALAQLFVFSGELRPQALRAYGDLSDEQAQILAEASAEIGRAVQALMHEYTGTARG
jgi:hypothetical protein